METLTIKKEDARKAWAAASPELKETLKLLLGGNIQPDPMTFKNYEDVCEAAGIDPVKSLPFPKPTTKKEVCNNGNFKLQTIFDEFNRKEDGSIWEPNYTDQNEYKYYGWYEWSPSVGGFVYTRTHYTLTYTGLGARLCTNTDAKMKRIANVFIKEINEFLNPQI